MNKLGDGCFKQSGLKSIKIPNQIKELPTCTFENCSALKNVTFEENSELEIIGSNCF